MDKRDKIESGGKKQKRLGPAPIASFEDISDEVRQKMESISPPESRLPDIIEHSTLASSSTSDDRRNSSTSSVGGGGSGNASVILSQPPINLGVLTPSTPRIDISRASSSSYHEDSRDSSPENVFDQVGTGTLQEPCLGGFNEDGTMDLRSSTEELYFMEPSNDRNNSSENRDQISQLPHTTQTSRRSPIMFKFDEQHHQSQGNVTTPMQQHQRKDSASSEVAALLSISGRTSRISSVGSQGSAVSRLSAISGISRSPSPHRMLLETSFCGPKPVDSICDPGLTSGDNSPAEIMEQVLLSRKHDPTQAVFAEGIEMDLSASPKKSQAMNGIESTAKRKTPKPMPDLKTPIKLSSAAAPRNVTTGPGLQLRKGISTKKDLLKPIIGVTPSGTEYIRIKLKPDHLYDDKGLGDNERIVDGSLDEILKKPVSLNLDKNKVIDADRISRHPDSISTSSTSTIKNASPKPARHVALARDQGSRSPSPATVTVSRKSSFCSLFRSKETTAHSPDSPRDRSRSKSRERIGDNSTPNKQKSVLAIFKTTRKMSGSKSKSSSPVDPDSISQIDNLSQVEFHFEPAQTCGIETSSQSRSSRARLRYYEAASDGTIHIPLHTPPEEKDVFKKTINKENIEPSTTTELPTCNIIQQSSQVQLHQPKSVHKPAEKSRSAQERPAVLKTNSGRIEHPDGSITIPLRSPTEVTPHENVDSKEVESVWSLEVQRHSSQESQETVISLQNRMHSNKLASVSSENIVDTNNALNTLSSSAQAPPVVVSSRKKNSLEKIAMPSPSEKNAIISNTDSKQTPIPPPPTPATAAPPKNRVKKHIVFSTDIGRDGHEQIFTTQFSISKSESLSSQKSEHANGDITSPINLPLDVEPVRKEEIPVLASPPEPVVLRAKKPTLQEELSSAVEIYQEKMSKDDAFNANRHSRYIENIDEIMEAQKKLTASLTQNKREYGAQRSDEGSPINDLSPKVKSPTSTTMESSMAATTTTITTTTSNSSPSVVAETPKPSLDRNSTAAVSSDYQGSSESEKDSETESSMSSSRVKRHLPRNMGVVDDHEATGLVSQQSFEEDLPYIPTTLPEERTMGVPLIPVKERVHMELKMCPVERPRSTTPINPASLEEYCGAGGYDDHEHTPRAEKLKISLPRRNSKSELKSSSATSTKSPRRISTSSQKSWFDFAVEQGSKVEKEDDAPPPPLPPRKIAAPPIPPPSSASTTATSTSASSASTSTTSQSWINFEDIPEKRKMPKKITTLPLKEQIHQIQYNYVNPEDCQCECHESERHVTLADELDNKQHLEMHPPPEDILPLLEPDHSDCIDRTSDSSVDYSYSDQPLLRNHESADHLHLDRPFGMDLSVNQLCGSNRSSIVSQEAQSPQDDSTKASSQHSKRSTAGHKTSQQ